MLYALEPGHIVYVALVAVIVKLKGEPVVVVGEPVIAPVDAFKDKPPGNAPMVTAYVNEPEIPLAVAGEL